MDGNRVNFIIVSPKGEYHPHGFKIEFECTNNVVDYEALILWSDVAKNMGIRILKMFGESYLIMNKVKEAYQNRELRLTQYKHEV